MGPDADEDRSKPRRDYDAQLNQGLRLSGEEKVFFIRGRLADLRRALPPHYRPARVLDFGCGVGDTARCLAELFPQSRIVGVDTDERALTCAQQTHEDPRISFAPAHTLSRVEPFDLCYTNGVFHHIPPAERLDVVRLLQGILTPGGRLALFENNAWSLAARLVMKRIPFDRDAIPLSPFEARRLVEAGGFTPCGHVRFLFFFPRFLAGLRASERWLTRVPFGAQFHLLAIRR